MPKRLDRMRTGPGRLRCAAMLAGGGIDGLRGHYGRVDSGLYAPIGATNGLRDRCRPPRRCRQAR